MKQPDIYVVILAGGQGSRFWPVSRVKKPKQFLPLGSTKESLIQATARRASSISSLDKLLIVTNALHTDLINEHVPGAQQLIEPQAKNTAAAIAYAATWIAKRNPEAVMIIMPADHAVRDENKLKEVLLEASELAAKEPVLVTIGIKPRSPNTAYGYIRTGMKVSGRIHTVMRFYEKPNAERAKMYHDSGEYSWNSGMFVWRAKTILESFAEEMPEMNKIFTEFSSHIGTKSEDTELAKVYEKVESISIDFGILEHARNCAVIVSEDFGWNDVGSWDAWAEGYKTDNRGNYLHGDALAVDSDNCIVSSDSRMIALLGAKNMVVIDSGDALLVCPKERVQDVKKIVEELKAKGRKELL